MSDQQTFAGELRYILDNDPDRLPRWCQETAAWADVAAESFRAMDAALVQVDPSLPSAYGMPVDGLERVRRAVAGTSNPRGVYLVQLNRLARAVRERHGGVVGFSASASDNDWCIYHNGQGVIFGKSAVDIARVESDMGRADWSIDQIRYYGLPEDA